MKSWSQIKDLISNDDKIIITDYRIAPNPKDPLHVRRKHQQRGIRDEYVLIAINYGVKGRTYSDFSYSLNDRVLMHSIYKSYIDDLRGLSVIGYWEDETFFLRTSFWDYTIKSRKRF